MGFENRIARIMRNTGPARFFVPLGIILIVFGIAGMILSPCVNFLMNIVWGILL